MRCHSLGETSGIWWKTESQSLFESFQGLGNVAECRKWFRTVPCGNTFKRFPLFKGENHFDFYRVLYYAFTIQCTFTEQPCSGGWGLFDSLWKARYFLDHTTGSHSFQKDERILTSERLMYTALLCHSQSTVLHASPLLQVNVLHQCPSS